MINVSNLTFAYDGSYENIFENVSFRLDTSWKLGFTGRNGRGKTTFLNLLLGKYEYSGTITSHASFEYFPYDVPDKTAETHEVIGAICPDYQQWELERELSLLNIDSGVLYRPYQTLSEGERTKVQLAAMFLKENHFLLIDEPTNHLDLNARAIVRDYLNSKSGFILVSHDRALLDGCIDHVLSINKTDIEVQRGNFSSWMQNKERRDSFEFAENEKLKKDIAHLSAAAKRTSGWSDKVEKSKYAAPSSGLSQDRGYIGHKSAKMMKRAKSIETRRESAMEEKSKLLKNIENSDDLKIMQVRHHSSRLLSLDRVSVSYGNYTVCSDVTFTVERGDRIALRGKNGSGKSSILKLICGEDISYGGDFQKAGGLIISTVSQDTSNLSGNLSDYAVKEGIDESIFKAMLRKLDFSRTQFEKDMRDFSGGQKKKVLIAKSLTERSHLLVWDEPLNFIDVISRIQIEELLLKYQPTILFVEHDSVFCDKIATKTIEL